MDIDKKLPKSGDETPNKTDPSGTSEIQVPNTANNPSLAGHRTEPSSSMACIANSSHANVHCRPTSSMPLNIPSTVTVPVNMISSSSPTTRTVYGSDSNSEKTPSKKRCREDNAISHQQSHIVHGFQPPPVSKPSQTTTPSRTNGPLGIHSNKKRSSSFTSSGIYANPQTSSVATTDSNELVLTKEQLVDVIDTTLPTNFTFQLPIAKLHPKPKIGRPKGKKPRPELSQDRKFSSSPKSPSQPQCSSLSVGSGGSGSGSASGASSKTSGRWTREEHEAFLEGLKEFGREWKKVAKRIPTRTSAQIRSHAQKYFAKLAKDEHLQAACLASQTASRFDGTSATGEASGVGPDAALESSPIESDYSSSVLERISKILNDPKGAEREVAETLKRLKWRYDELHRKLQQQEEEKARKDLIRQGRLQNQSQADPTSSEEWKDSSRTPQILLHSKTPQKIEEQGHGHSTVTSSNARHCSPNLPSTYLGKTPPVTLSSETLALHSSELIALTVLGGELYRSSSREDLTAAAGSARSQQTREGTPNHPGGINMMPKTPSPTRADTNNSKEDGSNNHHHSHHAHQTN